MRSFITMGLLLAMGIATWPAIGQDHFQGKVEDAEHITAEINRLLAGQAYATSSEFPDMQAIGLPHSFQPEAPFETTLKLTASALNTGATFDHKNAFLVLSCGNTVWKKTPLGKVEKGGVVTLEHSVKVYYYPSPFGGTSKYADIVARIEYDPNTKALSKKHIDDNFKNNQKSLPQAPIADQLEKDYRKWHRKELFTLINQYRAQAGKKSWAKTPLKPDSTLEALAQQNSELMFAKGTVGHMLPGDYWENVSGSGGPKDVLDGWKKSPGHNDNLLKGFTKIGIGQKGGYVTARFD